MINNSQIQSWFNIRSGEQRSTALMLVHSFFMGISTVFFETAASALFLAQFEATALPFVYLAALEYGLTPDTIRNDSPITIGGRCRHRMS